MSLHEELVSPESGHETRDETDRPLAIGPLM